MDNAGAAAQTNKVADKIPFNVEKVSDFFNIKNIFNCCAIHLSSSGGNFNLHPPGRGLNLRPDIPVGIWEGLLSSVIADEIS
jgi:hypothetical protein